MDKKIHILWATIRPDVFNSVYKYWMDNADVVDLIVPHVLVDTDEDKRLITSVPQDSVVVNKPPKKGVCYPSYILSSSLEADDDIVIYASDDFFPMDGWDSILYDEFDSYDGGIVVCDACLSQEKNVITIPIMTYRTLLRLNKIIYHPAYTHCFSDNELFSNLTELGLLKDIRKTKPDVVFEHRHYATGKRNADVHDTVYGKTYNTERELWLTRKDMSLDERLVVDKEVCNG